MLIDSHQHFWRIGDRTGHWPPPDLAAIHRDFLPADLEPILADNAVHGTVVVQSLPTLADTRFLLALAERHPFILGVVGWVDLKAADAVDRIAELATNPWLKGLRPMLQDLPEDDWIDDPAVEPAVEAMVAHGLAFDALVLPRHLPALTRFAARHPELSIVVDHAAKPMIARRSIEPWLSHLDSLAALRHVRCKLSGLLTEAGPGASGAALEPYVEAVFTLFGARRLMWGSDWPVVNLASSYGDWLGLARRVCGSEGAPSGRTPAELAAVFGDNARAFYRLEHRTG